MIEIARHREVTAIKGTLPFAESNMVVFAFLVDGLLIDTGPQSLAAPLADFFRTADIQQVVLTHHHEDHTGMASWIQQTRQIPIHIHPLSIEVCAKPGEYLNYRRQVWGSRQGFAALPMSDSFQTGRYKWQAVHTPGHSEDHLAFLNLDTGTLFAGDLFLTSKPKVIMRQESIPQVMDSIRALLELDFTEMYCSHAGYLPDGKRMLAKKLEYLENVSGEILRLHEEGYSIREINQTLFPVRFPIIQISEGEWDSEHIVRSVLKNRADDQ